MNMLRCKKCRTPITSRSKTGLCHQCSARNNLRKINVSPWTAWTEERRTAQLLRLRLLNDDPSFRAKQRKAARKSLLKQKQDPEFQKKERAASSKHMKALNQNLEYRKRRAAAARRNAQALNANPKFQKLAVRRLRARWKDPTFRKEHSRIAKQTQRLHPEIRLNGWGKKTKLYGVTFPSMNQARMFEHLVQLGAEPMFEKEVSFIETPFGNTYPDTQLKNSVLSIPADIPLEMKDGDGMYEWSLQQVWAVENGETYLLCAEDLFAERIAP